MNITKYEHACVVIEEQGKKLIIDPGEFTTSLRDLTNVIAVVVTHIHADHCKPETLQAIIDQNPTVRLFSTAEVAKAMPGLPITAVTGSTTETVAPFNLGFFGELHALIHTTIPRIQNIGVLVNDTFYYPGDSFTTPDRPIKTLACPSSAPWLRANELIDFLRAIKPGMTFPTHNALLSEIGHGMMNGIIQKTCTEHNGAFMYLKSGESLAV